MRRLGQTMVVAVRLLPRSLLHFSLGTVVAGWYLIALSGPAFPTQQWLWLEVVAIPLGAVLSTEPFLGRYERGELEAFLARRSARSLYAILLFPCMAMVLTISGLLVLAVSEGDLLAALARTCLALGVIQLLSVAARARWFVLSVFGLWWAFGLIYMRVWAEASPVVAVWHPMRLSGGGSLSAAAEWNALMVGVGCVALAWWCVGPDARWFK